MIRDRKTPLTDAAVVSSEYIHREIDKYKHKFVLADYASRLEQERDAAVEALKWLENACTEEGVRGMNNLLEHARAVLAEIGEKG